jgi:glycosyltransferase involved in cell wall biosynthesis
LPGNITVIRYNTKPAIKSFVFLPSLLFNNIFLIKQMIKEELKFRDSIKFKVSVPQKVFLLKKIIKAIQLRNFIQGNLRKEKINSDITFYSYWLNTGAHAISTLGFPKSIKIARAHGSDLYEEKSQHGYLPLLYFTCRRLDRLFFISQNGLEYFSGKITGINNFKVSRLGVNQPDQYSGEMVKTNSFNIVSCSNLIPLKRIHLIIKALSSIKSDKEIKWFHFGEGILMKELMVLAAEQLGQKNRVNYSFMGHYSNDELMKFYKNHQIDLFINTSFTEGVPVSIMEAQSYGIPVIATDVGGVKELVRKGTGFLLNVDFKIEELTDRIEYFMNLDPEERKGFKANAFSNWEENYNASKNYRQFIIEVNSILASKIRSEL